MSTQELSNLQKTGVMLFFLLPAIGSLYIFAIYFYEFVNSLYQLNGTVIMYKSAYAFLGIFIGLFTFFSAFCIFKVFKLAEERDHLKIFTIFLLAGIAITFLLPQAIHISTSNILTNKGYSFCQEMSHTSFKFSKRVYVRDAALCIEDDQRL